MEKQKEISSLKPGDKINHILLLSAIQEKTTQNQKKFITLVLSDASGRINAILWDNLENYSCMLKAGTIVSIIGDITEYQGSNQLKITSIKPAEGKQNIEEFFPKSRYNRDDLINRLKERIEEIKKNELKELLNILFLPEMEVFSKIPAGKAWHHAYISGLLEHTLEIVRICDLMCEFHKEIDRDLLITGALLHDFGKTQELTVESGFEYTDKGRLIGHIVIAAIEIEKACNQISGFPERLKDQIIHLVLSHQGKLEFASPVVPKTIEAIVLYHADELSAKANAYKNAILKESQSDNNWTKFIGMAETALFIPERFKDIKQQE